MTNKYEEMSYDELIELWGDSTVESILIQDKPDLDRVSLYLALEKAKKVKEIEDAVGVKKEFLQLAYDLGKTCLSDLLDKHHHDEGFPKGIERLFRFYDFALTNMLETRKCPLQGYANVVFRRHVQAFTDALDYGLGREFEEGLGPIREITVTKEDFLKHQEVWLGAKGKYQDILDQVVGDIVTPKTPTLNLIGVFEVEGKIIASDPGYGSDEKDVSAVLEAQPGTWEASVCSGIDPNSGWGYRTMHLFVSLKGFEIDPTRWKMHTSSVSVESGQGGFYCLSAFPEEQDDDDDSDNPDGFYGGSCLSTDSDFQAGIHPNGHGVTSMAGFGDGGYSVYYIENDEGKVCAAKIVYIDEDWGSTDPGMIKFDYIFRRTSRLAELEDGWAGEGSKAPSMETLENARKFALNAFAPDFIFATRRGGISMYRVKWEKGEWSRYVMARICDGDSQKIGFTMHIKRGQKGNNTLGQMIQRDQFPYRTLLRKEGWLEKAIKDSWEFTDPKEESPDLAS